MPEKQTPTKRTPPPAKRAGATEASTGFIADEREAMRERAREVKRPRRPGKADGEADLLARVAELPEADRALAERVHAIVRASAPELSPTTWYGMPAYAKEGKVVCFFQSAQKFKTRYATLGFSDKAQLDEGAFWPVAYAVTKLTRQDEAKIAELVKKAVGEA